MPNKIEVCFPYQHKNIFVDENVTIAQACSDAGFQMDLVCGGRGRCRKCQVDIERDGRHETVLACREMVFNGLKVFLSDENINKRANILTENVIPDIEFNPSLKKIYIDKRELSTPPCSGEWRHICFKYNIDVDTPKLGLLQKLAKLLCDKYIEGITFVIWEKRLIEIEPGDTTGRVFGIAVDLGTTSVVAYLYDMVRASQNGIYSALNGQISEGGDIISRIAACRAKTDGLIKLQKEAVDTVNKLIKSAINENKISKEDIYEAAICGNSAMQHLFLGLDPEALGSAPFVSVIQKGVSSDANELGIDINPNGVVDFLPLIGGFVGADTTAVLLSIPKYNTKKCRLIIDLGTNGEIVVGDGEKYLASSTAAGPALEGAGINCGMRGTDGAIERVKITEQGIDIKVIGNSSPKGICGSGLIDAVAEMLRVGIIDHTGRMYTKEKYNEKSKTQYKGLTDNIQIINGINAFVLVDENNDGKKIFISQKDIRAVQLAKGAIYTGCRLLLDRYGINGSELDEILIAGAFGNYIDAHNGQYIGLLPYFKGVPVKSIGNAAGTGTQKYLLSEDVQKSTSCMLKNVAHLELASDPHFQREFIANTNFPRYEEDVLK